MRHTAHIFHFLSNFILSVLLCQAVVVSHLVKEGECCYHQDESVE